MSALRTGVTYIDHYGYVAQAYHVLGEALVSTFCPLDHTHTWPTDANVVAEACEGFYADTARSNIRSMKEVTMYQVRIGRLAFCI